MKLRDKRIYVDAIMQVVARRCKGRALPVACDALYLLNEACKRNDPQLPHSYSNGESRKVVLDLFDEIDRRCFCHPEDDVFPCKVIKGTQSLIAGIGHGRELVVDEKFTPEWYSHRAYPKRNDEIVGFVFFNRQVSNQHPVLAPSMSPRVKAVRTEMARINGNVADCRDRGLLDNDSAANLLVGSSSRPLLAG